MNRNEKIWLGTKDAKAHLLFVFFYLTWYFFIIIGYFTAGFITENSKTGH